MWKTLRRSLFSAQARWPNGDRTQRERKLVGDTTKNAAIREQDLTSVRFIYSYTPSCHSSGVNKSKWERALVPGTLNHRALDRVRFNLSSHLNYILLSLWHFLFSCSCIKVNPDRYFELLYFDCFKKFCRLE